MTTLKSRDTLLAPIPQRRKAFSLIRFSTPQQALGDSARRQYDRTVTYCEANNLELVETIRDEGMSGLHGVHRKKGAFGRFVKRFLAGEIPADGVFICEGFDRFTREPVRIAQQLFLSLINGDENTHGGLEVVTLIDGKRYTAESIDHNVGELYTSIALMLGAHMESKNKGDRIHEGWNAPNGRRNGGIGKETGLPSNNFPAWIVKTKQGPELDKAKARTLNRICKLIETMGCEQMAKRFNDEGVPTLNTRKRPGRAALLWDKTAIQKMIRGRQVLGEQAIGRYIDVKDPRTSETTFKRVLTGEVKTNAYPAVWTQEEWLAANHALDRRKRGVQTGRNAITYANLFGPLAVCGMCGGIMKIRGRGRLRGFKYLGCSNAGLHGCTNTQYYRLDKVEADTFAMIGALTWPERDKIDETDSLTAQLSTAKRDAEKTQRNLDALTETFADAPSVIKLAMLKVAAEHAERQATVTSIERRLAALRSRKPVDLDEVQTITGRLQRLQGKALIETRGKIAARLPTLFREFQFDKMVNVTLVDGRMYQLGEWVAAGGVLYHPDGSDGRHKVWAAPVWRDPDFAAAGRRAKRALDD
jgi:DNA invertase Pin-like site-specific DNA recombinase